MNAKPILAKTPKVLSSGVLEVILKLIVLINKLIKQPRIILKYESLIHYLSHSDDVTIIPAFARKVK